MVEKRFTFDLSDFGNDEACYLAVCLEDEGYTFYTKILEAAEESRIKNEVKFLRDEEVRHKTFFQKQIKEKIPPETEETLREFVRREFVLPMEDFSEGNRITKVNDALRLGGVLEQKSIDFYEALKQKDMDEKTLSEIETIIEEEKKHLKKIYIILSY